MRLKSLSIRNRTILFTLLLLCFTVFSYFDFKQEPLALLEVKGTADTKEYTLGWEEDFYSIKDTGDGVKVAILDTELTKKVYNKIILHPKNTYSQTNMMTHGDAILYLVSKFAPKSQLYYMDVNTKDGISMDKVIDGIQWAIKNKVDVINMSFTFESYDRELEINLKEASESGIVLVAPTGNEGANEIFYPANSKYVYAIGTSTANNEKWKNSNFGKDVLFCFPGDRVKISKEDNKTSSGTSLSAAIFTGIFSSVKAEYNFSNSETIEVLSSHALKVPEEFCGNGIPKLSSIMEDF